MIEQNLNLPYRVIDNNGFREYVLDVKVQAAINLKDTKGEFFFLRVVEDQIFSPVMQDAFTLDTGLIIDPDMFKQQITELAADESYQIDYVFEQFICFVHLNVWKRSETLVN